MPRKQVANTGGKEPCASASAFGKGKSSRKAKVGVLIVLLCPRGTAQEEKSGGNKGNPHRGG